MLYPLKFKPVYKDYIWGARNLEKIGKTLPEGIVAESWEVSCHPDGVSIISNGEFQGMTLPEYIEQYGRLVLGSELPQEAIKKFPLLVKLIDANDKLSVQVHPDDSYAKVYENGELGKNEMWYIISAKPEAKLVYGLAPNITRESFAQAVEECKIDNCLNYVPVFSGDVLNIPAGLVHAIGEGIMIAEIQQNSNTTYRLYDYDRIDKNGNKRPLHITKAINVIDFDSSGKAYKSEGLEIKFDSNSSTTYKVANQYFCVEVYNINSSVTQNADGDRFYTFVFTQGSGEIIYNNEIIPVKCGESVLIPASLGYYTLRGNFTALKAYVPDINENIIIPLQKAGYSKENIFQKVSGLVYNRDTL